MSSDSRKGKNKAKASASDVQQTQQGVFNNRQPTPIIITGGSLTFESPLVEFVDPTGKKLGHTVMLDADGYLSEVSIRDGVVLGDHPIANVKDVVINLNYIRT